MLGRIERTIEELYRDDPERADAVVFGRRVDPTGAASWKRQDLSPWAQRSAAVSRLPPICRAG